MTAEIRSDVIVATEHIAAPPSIVFPCFTDAALIVAWIGDRAELDPQPGGVFSLDFGEIIARGSYLAVEPPHRIVFTSGIPGNDTLPPGGSTVEVVSSLTARTPSSNSPTAAYPPRTSKATAQAGNSSSRGCAAPPADDRDTSENSA